MGESGNLVEVEIGRDARIGEGERGEGDKSEGNENLMTTGFDTD